MSTSSPVSSKRRGDRSVTVHRGRPVNPLTFDLCLVAGARPNFVKVAPILRAIERASSVEKTARLRPHLVHTGQHYDNQMSTVFFKDLDIPQPEINLNVGSCSQVQQTAAIMVAFEEYVEAARPNAVLVVGDVNSTLACSLVTAKLGLPLAHVEAGLRSFDRRMPEEVNRIVTDHLSELLFVSEESGVQNLLREGVDKGKIHSVGNVMIDTLVDALKKLDERPRLDLTLARYGLVTLHRPSNVDDRVTLVSLLSTLGDLSRDLPLLFPVHPRTAARIRESGLGDCLQWHESAVGLSATSGLHALPPSGYLEFVDLMRRAKVVFTDSGGIQEETTALGVPCITLRENTERPVTVAMGTNCVVGTRPHKIRAAFAGALAGKRKEARIPPLWDGNAAERIVDIIIRYTKKPWGVGRTSHALF